MSAHRITHLLPTAPLTTLQQVLGTALASIPLSAVGVLTSTKEMSFVPDDQPFYEGLIGRFLAQHGPRKLQYLSEKLGVKPSILKRVLSRSNRFRKVHGLYMVRPTAEMLLSDISSTGGISAADLAVQYDVSHDHMRHLLADLRRAGRVSTERNRTVLYLPLAS